MEYIEEPITEILKHPATDMIITIGGEKFKVIRVAGPIVTFFKIGHDTYLVSKNKISGNRYIYRMTGTSLSLIAVKTGGPLMGPVVGSQVYFYEKMYDSLKEWHRKAYRRLKNPNFYLQYY